MAGEAILTDKNQISLSAKSVRELGWERGDRLIVEVLAPDIVILVRRPERFAEAFAGRLTEVFGTQEETIQWLEEERDSWSSGERG